MILYSVLEVEKRKSAKEMQVYTSIYKYIHISTYLKTNLFTID